MESKEENKMQLDTGAGQLVPVVNPQEVVGKLLPDIEIQEIYLLAIMSRNIIIAQASYFLDLYKLFFKRFPTPTQQSNELKVGIIGCGRIGRALLTTILQSSTSFTYS